jgi:hypothetical protein
MTDCPSAIEHLWPVLLSHIPARTLRRLSGTCRVLRAKCLPELEAALKRANDDLLARLKSDLKQLVPLSLDPSCDPRFAVEGWTARFFDVPHQSAGTPLRPGTRTVSLRQTARGWIQIAIHDAHEYGRGRTAHWTVRSELTEVVLVPTCGWLAGCAYLGQSLSTFDAVWRLVESGAIRDMPVEHDVWW